MVRMNGVRVVSGDHEAVRQMDQVILTVISQAVMDPCECIVQEGGCRSLFRAASNFFVIQHA